MQLLMSPLSPYVRKVRVCLRETGLLSTVEEVRVTTSFVENNPQIIAANPTGRIPVLLRDDGPAIYDSRVITRFLDSISGDRLYPKARLWEVLTLEATADGIADSAVALTYDQRFRTPDEQSEVMEVAHWSKIARAVAALDGRWLSHLHGPLDAGQIAVACVLAYLDFRHDARNWRAGNDALAAWFAGFAARESMQATRPV